VNGRSRRPDASSDPGRERREPPARQAKCRANEKAYKEQDYLKSRNRSRAVAAMLVRMESVPLLSYTR
jgi:hypothetical protein